MLLNKRSILMIILCLTGLVQAQTLDDYLTLAGKNNPGLKAKYLEYQAALEKVPQVGALPNPKLSFGYFIMPIETRVGAQQARFSVSQMFPWFGALGAKKDAATFMAKAKFEAFEANKNKLYYQVKTVYYKLWQLKEEIKLMEENLEILKSYESLATTKYENGKASLVDVIRVQLQIDVLSRSLSIVQQKKTPLNRKFNALINRDATIPVQIEGTLPIAIQPVKMKADSLLALNPLLSQLDMQALSFEHSMRAAKKDGLPTMGIGLDYALVNERTDMDVPENGQNILMPMVSLSLPIYRKKYKAMKNEVGYQLEAVNEMKADLINNLETNYEEAHWQYEDALSRVALYKSQIEKSESALTILITAYSSDNKDFEEVLRMQQQILMYETQGIKAEADLRLAISSIDFIIGK